MKLKEFVDSKEITSYVINSKMEENITLIENFQFIYFGTFLSSIKRNTIQYFKCCIHRTFGH